MRDIAPSEVQLIKTLIARINSRLLSQYKGHTVRLTAKVLKLVGDTATVQASDGGEVRGCYPCLIEDPTNKTIVLGLIG